MRSIVIASLFALSLSEVLAPRAALAVNRKKCVGELHALDQPFVNRMVQAGYDEYVARRIFEVYPDFVKGLEAGGEVAAPKDLYRAVILDRIEDFNPRFMDHHVGAQSFEMHTTTDIGLAADYAILKGNRKAFILRFQVPKEFTKPGWLGKTHLTIDTRTLKDSDIGPFLYEIYEYAGDETPGFVRPAEFVEFMKPFEHRDAMTKEFMSHQTKTNFWIRPVDFEF